MWQKYVQTAENTSNRREAINRYMVRFTLLSWLPTSVFLSRSRSMRSLE